MKRTKTSLGQSSLSGNKYSNKTERGNDINLQLQLPLFNELFLDCPQRQIEELINTKTSRYPVQLETSEKRMQSITRRRDKLVLKHIKTGSSLLNEASVIPITTEISESSTANGEDVSLKELPETFNGKAEVRDFRFTLIKRTSLAYLYEVQGSGAPYFEIFERKINSQYGNVTYPSSKAFGKWAWTTSSLQKAEEYFERINRTKGNALCA